ncbi:MAG: isoprenyl transferase [Deltaproteobacteria bacterium]|nr:isoprenyl transferase [Deltaproteobacteria bacterium]
MLSPNSDQSNALPTHVAIIMDGNGRWAKKRFMPRLEGHRQGAKSVRRAVEFCRKNGVKFLTLYAFSTENWQRPESEVSGLMKLLSQFIDSEIDEIHKNDIRFNIVGETKQLPAFVKNKIERALAKTSENQTMVLTVALSYGGRQEIISAALKVHQALLSGRLKKEDINERVFSSYLNTVDLPDPDLLIRTGGEIRISNFLLWQLAYTELYFTDVLWPDFDENSFWQAIEEFRSRQRRYGKISEQIQSKS